MDPGNPPKIRTKLQRVTQACDFCHRRGLKCEQPPSSPGGRPPSLDGTPRSPVHCLTCLRFEQPCTHFRKPKKRGTKPRKRPEDGCTDNTGSTGSTGSLGSSGSSPGEAAKPVRVAERTAERTAEKAVGKAVDAASHVGASDLSHSDCVCQTSHGPSTVCPCAVPAVTVGTAVPATTAPTAASTSVLSVPQILPSDASIPHISPTIPLTLLADIPPPPSATAADPGAYSFATTPDASLQSFSAAPRGPDPQVIDALIKIYLDSIYPLYPFFCETELVLWWNDETPTLDAAFYTSVLCMCALSALQAERGALFSPEPLEKQYSCSFPLPHDAGYRPDNGMPGVSGMAGGVAGAQETRRAPPVAAETPGSGSCFVPSREQSAALLQYAVDVTPLDYRAGQEVSLLRCYGILACIGTILGDAELLHRYFGLYQGLATKIHLHDQERWPSSLTICQRESRQRIFWCVYRLEVHNACLSGHPIRIPEAQAVVDYPRGVHHFLIFPNRNGLFENWFAGWNYTTDLYRILEHAIVDFRSSCRPHSSILGGSTGHHGGGGMRSRRFGSTESGLSSSTNNYSGTLDSGYGSLHDRAVTEQAAMILQRLEQMQSTLKPHFSRAAKRSEDSGSNRCSFQVANIMTTVFLVKTVSLVSSHASNRDICGTVGELILNLRTVPEEYRRAFGELLVQELLGLGFLLISVIGRQADVVHFNLQNAVIFLIGYLDELSNCITSSRAAASCLRASLWKVDQDFMRIEQGRVDSAVMTSSEQIMSVPQVGLALLDSGLPTSPLPIQTLPTALPLTDVNFGILEFTSIPWLHPS